MTLKFALEPSNAEDILYTQAGTPTLDLRFASSKSLNDNVSGQNLIDFTRGGNGVGTYVGSDGLIKNSVVNLLKYSEEFDNVLWGRTGTTTATLDSSQGSPFLGAAVYRINFPGGGESVSQSYTYSAVSYAASIWVKGTSGETIRFGGQSGVAAQNFTLTGNWQRLSLLFTGSAGSATFGINSASGATARTLWVTAAQLEASSTVGEYVKTTSSISGAPRFDHNPTTGESLGLLIEEQRANLATQSQSFAAAPYATTNGTITDNQSVAPNGTTTAASFLETTGTGGHNIGRTLTVDFIPVSIGTVYTFTIFVKANGRDFVQITCNTGHVTGNPRANYDLASASLGTVDAASTASIVAYPNGWRRLSFTVTSAVTMINFLVNTITSSTAARFESFAGDTAKGFFIWGYSVEAGAFPTSYIPTTTAAATRSADVASISGSNFSSWYRQDEGTVLCETQKAGPVGTSRFPRLYEISDNSSNEVLRAQRYGAGTYRVNVLSGGTVYAAFDAAPSVVEGATGSFALAYALNDIATCVNSGSIATDTSALTPAVTQINIGDTTVAGGAGALTNINGAISRLTYFDRRLPNDTLQSITSDTAPTTYGNLLLDSANAPAAIAGVAPTLDYRFAREKREIETVSLLDKLTYTGGNGTFVGSDGYIQRATTNLPRFDHDPTTGESLGLLVEEQRTNLLLQSEDFSTTWTASNLTVTTNQIAAPTGTTTADLVTGNVGTAIKRLRQNVATTSLGPWTFSVWLKTNTATSALVTIIDSSIGGVNNVRTTLTFSTGAVSLVAAAGTATGASASVQDFGNGWYRVSITGTFVTALTSIWAEIWLDGFTTTANETSFYSWGAQLEAGSFPTSYIPTTTTTVTRTADSAIIDGTGILTGTYTIVEKPAGCVVESGGNIELQAGYTAERVMVFPASLSAQQITDIRSAM